MVYLLTVLSGYIDYITLAKDWSTFKVCRSSFLLFHSVRLLATDPYRGCTGSTMGSLFFT